jgi:hypothetical protein
MAGIFDIGIDLLTLEWGSLIKDMIDACFIPITGRIVSFVGGGLGEYFHSFMEMIWMGLGG